MCKAKHSSDVCTIFLSGSYNFSPWGTHNQKPLSYRRVCRSLGNLEVIKQQKFAVESKKEIPRERAEMDEEAGLLNGKFSSKVLLDQTPEHLRY